MIDFRKLRNEYIRRSLRYANGVRALYNEALAEIAREFALVDYTPDVVFSFDRYGKFGRVDSIMSRLESQIQQAVNIAIGNEFGTAYKAHSDLLELVLGTNVREKLERAFAPRMTSGNAAKLYISETAANNITHSTRVWNGAVLGQMETAVQEALMEGMPAKQMAGLLEKYLNDPESCFRRFRIKTGVDANGKSMYGRKWKKRVRNENGSTSWFDADPRDYPTGQGVYHSSYQNALRYTRTSTNIAYRTADYERYQTEDFVLGFEIHITGNPAHKEDICDMLQGRYPKDFKWVGWHPNCYSDDTEVYTKDGWKLFKDVKDDDLILSLNPQTEKLEYVGIAERQCFMHYGKMVHFLNEDIDCLVTPEHQMVYVDRHDGKIKKCCASDYHCLVGPFLGLLDFETVCKLPSRFVKEINDYTGNVYDLTLERNHIMYIRRNGKCFWGSNCMCYQVPILATPEEVNAMADAILNDQDPASVPVAGRVTDVPDNFKEWVADNEDRIQDTLNRGKELPYFLRDNKVYMDEAIGANGSLIKNPDGSSISLEQVRSMQHSVFDYAQSFAKSDESIQKTLNALMNSTDLNEQYRLTLELKEKCASYTQAELLRTHRVHGMTYVCNLFDEPVSPDIDKVVFGQHIKIDAVKADLVLYRDVNGKEYAYAIGIDPTDVMNANLMKTCTDALPKAMKGAYDRFTFLNFRNPLDPYWRAKYNNPEHITFASDGRNIHFYMPVNERSFNYALPHELGHSLDKKYGLQKVWQKAIDADQTRWDAGYSKKVIHAPSEYALMSIEEDIAESFRLFVEDREAFEFLWPNRYKIIESIAGMM